MQEHLQTNSPRTRTVIFFIIILGLLFVLIGCAGIYKKLGMTPEQAQAQVDQDNAALGNVFNQARSSTQDMITTAIAGIGTIASGFLARWLGTERKINKILITGIEKADNSKVKEIVNTNAINNGLETRLHKRVLKYT